MGKTKVFISSTFVDLKDTRESLKQYFLDNQMEPILFERGSIAFDPYKNVDSACYNEVEKSTIFVLIIGGRYGSPASDEPKKTRIKKIKKYNSITKKEYLRARENNIPIFTFIDKEVSSDYRFFRRNRDKTHINYPAVDNVNIFYLLDEIYKQTRNNYVKEYEYTSEIIDWLKIQISGLFQNFVEEKKAVFDKNVPNYYVNPFKLFYKRRTIKNLTLKKLSQEVGIDYKSLCNLEKFDLVGTTFDYTKFQSIDKNKLKKLCNCLNCSFQDVISPNSDDFSSKLIEYYHNYKKKRAKKNKYLPNESFTTKVVVFDFDGTLTIPEKNKTTWEMIWDYLGYDENLCSKYHNQYVTEEINHSEWCNLTLEKFKDKNLNINDIKKIAKKIILVNGLQELLVSLDKLNIKLYILSGSIEEIVELSLGKLKSHFREISANNFYFGANGNLEDIIGTEFDFKGKATYLKKIITKEKIAPYEVLFVGNSINDIFAYESGAKTLCVNPILTNPFDEVQWQYSIPKMINAMEIMKFVNTMPNNV
ncbi:DUF4062 domain-containing protein [Algibacter luteus]|uniref:DUF4062 domain-containing protein n=1 Tax=Algibacter luteus TaxID=1178825 RepID=UPI002599DF8A|nr:DUF4062 domain-containing protein [Algibacter luteus]WJJ95298.1 DUF4062 domain-containing protein [Algibacter luteus]